MTAIQHLAARFATKPGSDRVAIVNLVTGTGLNRRPTEEQKELL